MKTVLDIKIDYKKSHGSYLFDQKKQVEFLDFLGMFSSLPLGYNHEIFDGSFEEKIKYISKVRMANNLIETDELSEFINKFREYVFSDFIHLTCTGALAVESAIKCAMEYNKVRDPMVLALKGSFHGINSWGFITDRYLGTNERIKNFPQNNWLNLEIEEIEEYIEKRDISNLVAVVIEPIQCTAGDIYLDVHKLRKIRDLCEEKDICFIVDEIQVGFGVTGKMWYSEWIDLGPDVLIFGKKSQICGVVAKEKYNECIVSPYRKLEVTFDGELIDAVRATYILKAYEKYDLLYQVQKNSKRFSEILKDKVLNYRNLGHLIAFDFETKEERDYFVKECFGNKLLCNAGGEKSTRMRPSLAITKAEIDHFESIVNSIL